MTATLDRPSRSAARPEGTRPGRPGARLRGRWRVALRYGARDARRHKGRTALVAVMVTLPVALGTFASVTLWTARDTPERQVATELGPDLQASLRYVGDIVVQDPRGIGFGTSPATDSANDGAAAAPDGLAPTTTAVADVEAAVAAALPTADSLVPFAADALRVDGPRLHTYATALQTDPTSPAVAAAFPLAEGHLPGDGEVAIAAIVADELGVGVGDTVTTSQDDADAQRRDATVSGLLLADQPQGADLLLPPSGVLTTPDVVDLSSAFAAVGWFVSGATPVTWGDVLGLNDVGVVAVSRDVLLNPPDRAAVPYFQSQPERPVFDRIAQWGPVVAVIAIALLEAVLLIGPAFAVGARRSARALAVVAANGGTARTVRAMVLGAGVVIGAAAASAGVLLGIAAAAVLVARMDGAESLRHFAVPTAPVLGIGLVGVGLATVAAWLPARGASKADVVAVLAGRRGETSHRRWPAIAGGVLAVAGFGAAIGAGVARQPLALAAGVIIGEIGLVMACGGIIALLGRLAGRLPLAWRFALRDAARNRSRTSPAIAAVLVACAGASAGLVYSYAQSQHDIRSQLVTAAPDVLLVSASAAEGLTSEQVDAVRDAIAQVAAAPVDVHPVPVLRMPDVDGVGSSVLTGSPDVERGWVQVGNAITGPVVDDGGLVDLLGLPDAAAARAALEAGKAVVLAGDETDGVARLRVQHWAVDTGAPLREDVVEAPALGVGDAVGPSNAALPVLPAAVAQRLGGEVVTGGVLARTPHRFSNAEQRTLDDLIGDELGTTPEGWPPVGVGVGGPPRELGAPQWLSTLIIAGSAGLLALAAAWIATALAATESRPDLATLAAVGAKPSTRKRLVAAQAGTIAGIGALVGAASGVALGAAFVLFERYRDARGFGGPDPTWSVVVPWPVLAGLVVGLPLLAVTAAWLVTRSRLVLTHRTAG
ncbi:ABC transporter permease [Xylanimonas ulmi]|uniref:Putative ABC transport system permease protein n=1 Tax=Xylanimonas ulmi TaxID=228973 RepID=A0A4Q7M5H0_9MICO|nr:ABC transporter permease [Xylanibacterium ulmi]RZS63216.1 putative ABC transport system permease protein [Xylanibacterium ulmi]